MEENDVQLQPGEKLRREREAHELSVTDVAVRLKLSIDKIDALERGDIEGLAAPVFIAGYLRTYARLLNLPEEEVLADFSELLPIQDSEIDSSYAANGESFGKVANEISSQFSLREKSVGNHLGIIGAAGVFVLVLIYVLWPSSEVVRTNAADVVANSIADKNTVPQVSEETISEKDVAMEKTVSDLTVDEDQIPDAGNIETAEPAEMLVSESVAVAPTPSPIFEELPTGMRSELVLIFNSDSWAEVQDARGQRLVYRLGKSGKKRVVTGAAPFMVQLGYVQGVDIFYNGARYDLSAYANRRSVRLRIGETGDRMNNE